MMFLHGEEPATAEPILREAVAAYAQHLPRGHWFLAIAEINLGVCLMRLERYDEAETLLLRGHGCAERERGPTSSDALSVKKRLVELYEAWGKPGQAATWRRK